VALHTDICSPLATNPTWSGLSKAQQAALLGSGVLLWHRLVEYLQPDIVIASIARIHRERISFDLHTQWESLHCVQRANPYHVYASRRKLASGKQSVFVYGQAAQTPFGLVSRADQEKIGSSILEAARHH
jgi:hypothetical protein